MRVGVGVSFFPPGVVVDMKLVEAGGSPEEARISGSCLLFTFGVLL